MNIPQTETIMLPVAMLHGNDGQIPGVPANPRFIREDEFKALCESMRTDNLTGVLQMKVYNHAGEWVVLDGNMRLKALQTLDIEQVQCVVVPQDAPAKVLRKIVALSNSTFGEWDFDMLANEWDADELHSWGVDIPNTNADDEKDLSDNYDHEFKIEITCADETQQEQMFNELSQRGFECRILTL